MTVDAPIMGKRRYGAEVKQFCAMDELSCSGIAVSLIGIRWEFGRIGIWLDWERGLSLGGMR